jgi:hypothetical protein
MSFLDDSEQNIKKYNSSFKEKKKSTLSLKETTAAGSVGGFVGRSGKEIDQLFAGAFHPDSGHGSKNIELLQKQIDDRKEIRSDMEDEAPKQNVGLMGTPSPIGGYFDIEVEDVELAYDELLKFDQLNKQFNAENTPPADIEWKSSGVDYEFDENEPYIEEEDFINTSETNMEYIKQDLEYDRIDASMGRDKRNKIFDKDYVQRSEDNNEKEIDEIKFNKDDFMEKSENNIGNKINDIKLVKDDFMKKTKQNIENEIENIELSTDDFLNRSEINLETIYKNDIGLSINIGVNK